ncbi:MAG: N-6 DNA methylase [Blastocatellia bacterium]|nr:N-6 DNA methylase [Blastocatellia bacterium]
MLILPLKPTQKPIQDYYQKLSQLADLKATHEGAVSPPFLNLLEHCCEKTGLKLIPQHPIKRAGQHPLWADGAILDPFHLTHGIWEAKDEKDDLRKEAKKKFEVGYPKDNILFQKPSRAILWQAGKEVLEADLHQPEQLVGVLKQFIEYVPPAHAEWGQAVDEFKGHVPDLARAALGRIQQERRTNQKFMQAFGDFVELCRQTVNPNLAEAAVEEMLIQHLLTERIFTRIFNNDQFTRRNVIAVEIEKVIAALTSRSFSRKEFLKGLDRFYKAIEVAAATIDDYGQKQAFLNTVYEKFFQGFSVKIADTHGIVYTPQPIVDFMVRSVEEILQKEFGRSLSDEGVRILDPFVGTGNFLVRVMREIKKSALEHKYKNELHCNEVMLLPYYIASMNIEHEYVERVGTYEPFEGICLVDTFELAEGAQASFAFMNAENTTRVNKQKQTKLYVIIGNPPYNVGQLDENDNNKNRKYKVMDKRVADTYARDSAATNKNALSDPYVKAIRWASDRIGEEGIVALVTNNSFLDQLAFDGMRKHLARDFSTIYVLDLGGNVRKNPKLSGTTHNVFGIQVGVSVNLLIKRKGDSRQARIYFARTAEFERKEGKYRYLEGKKSIGGIDWKELLPDRRHTWLTEGLDAEFETFIPLGAKEMKAAQESNIHAIFKNYGRGVATSRDAWAYNFNRNELVSNIKRTIETYNGQVFKWQQQGNPKATVDDFVTYDEKRLSWSRDLKQDLQRGRLAEFAEPKIRLAAYRPFTKQYLFFDRVLNEEVYAFPTFFPAPETERENLVIGLTDSGSEKPFMVLAVRNLPDLHLASPGCTTQCFPFYTYAEDGTKRRENITDWALDQFRTQYHDMGITKWDIFHYVYGLLHAPEYRARYAANLKRDLPHIPFAPDFHAFAAAGRKLAELHVNYENQPLYPLRHKENNEAPLSWRVEKMRLTKDKTALRYNEFLTLEGISPECFGYRLGNRSALDWVIDQYQVATDARSGITNDPNRLDDPQYIVRLVKQVVTVSLETVRIVNALPPLGSPMKT